MRIAYTLAEINATNTIGNIVLVETGMKKKTVPVFATTEEAVAYIINNDKNKSVHVVVRFDETYVYVEVSEELTLDILNLFSRHIPALIGFTMAVKGIMQMCRSMMASVKEDFLDLAKKYNSK